MPSGFNSKIKSIHCGEEELEAAFAPQSVVMTLEDEIDISRGDMIAKPGNQPKVEQDIDAQICWFSKTPMKNGQKFLIKHTALETKAVLKEIKYRVDINNITKEEGVETFEMNDIGRISLRTAKPLIHDSYRRNRNTGSFILVDPGTNETVAAGMII